jgi:hypothetical protein
MEILRLLLFECEHVKNEMTKKRSDQKRKM